MVWFVGTLQNTSFTNEEGRTQRRLFFAVITIVILGQCIARLKCGLGFLRQYYLVLGLFL